MYKRMNIVKEKTFRIISCLKMLANDIIYLFIIMKDCALSIRSGNYDKDIPGN